VRRPTASGSTVPRVPTRRRASHASHRRGALRRASDCRQHNAVPTATVPAAARSHGGQYRGWGTARGLLPVGLGDEWLASPARPAAPATFAQVLPARQAGGASAPRVPAFGPILQRAAASIAAQLAGGTSAATGAGATPPRPRLGRKRSCRTSAKCRHHANAATLPACHASTGVDGLKSDWGRPSWTGGQLVRLPQRDAPERG
jgi:hypothetical protein